MKQLYLLDGSWYVFRAYYGLPELHDPDGHNVNAIFGFFRMLFRLRQDRPDWFMVAWDAPTRTARKEINEDYKSNRVAMPDEFKRQMTMIKELVAQLQIPALEIPGFEADDIIATVTKQYAGRHDMGVKIVSSDKDLKQLLTDGVVMYDAMKNTITDQKSFLQEYGFPPSSMLDYLSLVGDSSDNIKGVTGIGAKGAAKLIQEFETIDNIYANIDKVNGWIKEKLLAWREQAYASKTLVTLMDPPGCDTPLDRRHCTYDFDTMKQILVEEYDFRSLEKIIDELKKQWQGGEQLSLFG